MGRRRGVVEPSVHSFGGCDKRVTWAQIPQGYTFFECHNFALCRFLGVRTWTFPLLGDRLLLLARSLTRAQAG